MILNKQEIKIKKRLFSIGGIQSHDEYFYELFKNDINLTEQEKKVMDGFYDLAGMGLSGRIVDDRLSNIIIKWILTGKKGYYKLIKAWFVWHLREKVKINEKRQKQCDKNQNIKNEQGSGYIYVIKSKNFYKIGRAKKLKDRIKTYRTENPFGIRVILQQEVNNYIEIETNLLKRFKNKQVRGEWFKLNDNDIEEIKEVLGILKNNLIK